LGSGACYPGAATQHPGRRSDAAIRGVSWMMPRGFSNSRPSYGQLTSRSTPDDSGSPPSSARLRAVITGWRRRWSNRPPPPRSSASLPHPLPPWRRCWMQSLRAPHASPASAVSKHGRSGSTMPWLLHPSAVSLVRRQGIRLTVILDDYSRAVGVCYRPSGGRKDNLGPSLRPLGSPRSAAGSPPLQQKCRGHRRS